MKKAFLAAAFPRVVIAAIFIADLTGTWKGTVEFQGNKLDITYKFKVDGDKLTGSVSSQFGEMEIQNGKVSGNDFSYSVDYGQGPRESKGKYYGDSIAITSGYSGNTTTFYRVKE